MMIIIIGRAIAKAIALPIIYQTEIIVYSKLNNYSTIY